MENSQGVFMTQDGITMWENAGSCIAVLIDRRTGEEFNIRRYSTSIGREIGCDVVLNVDKTISRQHALVQFREGKFFVQDLSSKNGTRLNGRKVDHLTELKNGDEVAIGLTQLIFVLIPQSFVSVPAAGSTSEITAETAAKVGALAAN